MKEQIKTKTNDLKGDLHAFLKHQTTSGKINVVDMFVILKLADEYALGMFDQGMEEMKLILTESEATT